jgi:hypothetical protein
MGWFDDNHFAGEAHNFGMGYMYGGGNQNDASFRRSSASVRQHGGNFEQGTRKCSNCHEYKTKSDFNKEEAKKPASKRVCNACGASLPKDLSNLLVKVHVLLCRLPICHILTISHNRT